MSTADKLNYTKTNIDKLKSITQKTVLSEVVSDIEENYGNGSSGGNVDTFWNARTNGGTSGKGLFAYTSKETCNNVDFLNFIENMDTSKMKSFNHMFDNSSFTELDFSKWNMNAADDITYMFYYSDFTKIDISNCNLNKIRNLSYLCYNSSNLTEINLLNCDTSNVTTMSNAFYNCKKLTKILGILDLSKTTSLSGVFGSIASNSPNLLEEVKIKNLNCTGLNLQYCIALSHDSLMYLINNLVETTTAKTLNLGATNLAKLTEEEIAVATEKGWTLA